MSSKTTFSISSMSVVKVVLVLLAFYTAYILRDLLLVFLAGVVIASAMEPMVQWFTKRKLPRVIAVVGIYVLISVLLVLSFYALFIPLLKDFSEFLTALPGYLTSAELWKPLQTIGLNPGGGVPEFTSQFSIQELSQRINQAISGPEGIWGSFYALFGGALSLVLVFVISFYLLCDR